ncbi:glycosyltransferase family 1 protein [Arthrobacter citreus]|uniref:Glycosyltransferase family 1 protein n=1 Tax=Arthrobacter citreus TaxID=1670 RepID=A0ABZ2ZS77_9MICC
MMPARILDKHVGGNTTYARSLAAGLNDAGIEVGRMPAHSHPLMTMVSENFQAIKRGTKGEVLHYVADTGPLVSCSRPSVLTLHGVASRWITTARNARQEAIWRGRVKRAVRSVDRIITVSESSADDISAVFDIDRQALSVIPHGIDVPMFSKKQEIDFDLFPKLPAAYALYVGNIEPRKNLVNLIRAFNDPRLRSTGVPLVIAGKPAWNHRETMELIESSDNVIYLGFVTDQQRVALMQNCALFIFPSLYEGFGFPVLEALAAGAVVASSDRGSLRDVAGPSLLLPGLDADGLAESIELALSDSRLREDCLRNGKRWADDFSWARSVAAHVAVYEGLTHV